MVDRDGLENRCAERYRGFESLLLRFLLYYGMYESGFRKNYLRVLYFFV